MKPTNPARTDKVLYLESLRGMAAFLVALHHINFLPGNPVIDLFLIEHAYLMVDLFFVLSGFVIALTYQDRIASLSHVVVFQIRRFLRLYPLHLVTFLAFVGIEGAKYLAGTYLEIGYETGLANPNDIRAGIHNLLLTQSIFMETQTFNYPSWSISTEFYTYLIFALLLLMVRGQAARIVAFIIFMLASMLVLATYELRTEELPMQLRIFRCIYAFFLGALLNVYLPKLKLKVPPGSSLVIFILTIYSIGFADEWTRLVYPFIFTAMITVFYLDRNSFFVALIEHRSLVFLGTVSYGLYMWHASLWWVVKNSLVFLFSVPVAHRSQTQVQFVLDPVMEYMILALCCAVLVAVSYLSYRFLEMPANDFRHRLKFDKNSRGN